MKTDDKMITIQKIPKHLICDAEKNLSSVVTKFVNTHTPLFAYSNDVFAGLLTVENSLYSSRHDPSSLISSCLLNPPKIFQDTPASEVLRLMFELKLYTLPVFDVNEKVIGLVMAKTLLEDLMKNPIFCEYLVEKLSKKPIITINEKAVIGEAFQIFTDNSISRLIVTDEKDNLKGVVTKRDLISLYFAPTNRQRFSTRNHPKNYSFDVEKIKRDQQPLADFITPIVDPIDENTNILVAIKKLLESQYNSIVFVNKQNVATSILSIRNILKIAVKITNKKSLLLTIISNLPEELNSVEKYETNRNLKKLARWIDKQEKLQFLKFSSDTVYSPEKKPILFNVNIKIAAGTANYFAKNKGINFNETVTEVIKQVKKQVRRKE